jgi:hypothetical protein
MRYDVAGAKWEQVAAFPSNVRHLYRPALSDDGRWLSFVVIESILPTGDRRVPVLMDLQSTEIRSPAVDVRGFTSFDSVITGDGRSLVISSRANLDPRVGNSDHNLELFVVDLHSGDVRQVTETTGGIGSTPEFCDEYGPWTNRDGTVLTFGGFQRYSFERCRLDGPQRGEADGFWLRHVRAVRRRPGNHSAVLAEIADPVVVAGETLTLDFTATDDDGDPISFFAQVVGAFDVPPGADMTDHHDGSATLRWMPRPEDAGPWVLRVAAYDEGGGQTLQDVTITVGSASPATSPPPTNVPPPASPTPPCAGDCNRDDRVTISELVLGTSIALGSADLSTCSEFDCRATASVPIDCLTRAVRAALHGCD